ncbi:hypothetical protein [Nostoc sp.]
MNMRWRVVFVVALIASLLTLSFVPMQESAIAISHKIITEIV